MWKKFLGSAKNVFRVGNKLLGWEKPILNPSKEALVWKTSTDVCLTAAYSGKRTIKNPNKKQVDMTLPVFFKVDNDFPVLDIHSISLHVRRINGCNELSNIAFILET